MNSDSQFIDVQTVMATILQKANLKRQEKNASENVVC